MDINESLQIAAVVFGVAVAAAVLVGNVYYVIRTKNYKLQEERLNHCNEQHGESQAQIDVLKHDISNLQGQISTLRDVPLHDIKDGIKSIVKTNGKILDTLRASAVTLERDTKETKTAVRTVKSDLEAA